MAQVLSEKEQKEINEQAYLKQFTLPKEHVPDILHLEEARKNPKSFHLKDKLQSAILGW